MYRAIYHPTVVIEEIVTRFGAIETNVPNLYHEPIKNKAIYRIDLIESISEDCGCDCLKHRDEIYLLLSGNCSDYTYRLILRTYYEMFPKFREYVNIKVLLGDKEASVLYRIINPLRRKIDTYYETVLKTLSDISAKVVMHTHEYVYFVLPEKTLVDINLQGFERLL